VVDLRRAFGLLTNLSHRHRRWGCHVLIRSLSLGFYDAFRA